MWDYAYGLLCELIDEEGVVWSKGKSYKGFQLGGWIQSQKKLYTEGKLSNERFVRLQNIGIIDRNGDFVKPVERNTYNWDFMYNLLKQYLKEYERFPLTLSEIYKGKDLANWCSFQRINYTRGKMTDERFRRLLQIGFPFQLQDYKFEVKVKELKNYIETNGTVIRQKGETMSLGIFYKSLKQNYRSGKLNDERKRLVESLQIPI